MIVIGRERSRALKTRKHTHSVIRDDELKPSKTFGSVRSRQWSSKWRYGNPADHLLWRGVSTHLNPTPTNPTDSIGYGSSQLVI
jgi:hypothetical protein